MASERIRHYTRAAYIGVVNDVHGPGSTVADLTPFMRDALGKVADVVAERVRADVVQDCIERLQPDYEARQARREANAKAPPVLVYLHLSGDDE